MHSCESSGDHLHVGIGLSSTNARGAVTRSKVCGASYWTDEQMRSY